LIEQETDHKKPRTKNQSLRTILVTGGAGFIGSNFIRYYLKEHPDCSILNLDKLTYAGNLANLADIEAKYGAIDQNQELRTKNKEQRYFFVKGDIADRVLVNKLFEEEDPDVVINFAAESHVDRSILDAAPFIETNIKGTQVLLDAARTHWLDSSSSKNQELRTNNRFIQISTDEVYGTLSETGCFTEESPLQPNSPYSASKASADLLCRAYFKTYALPIVITRCSNNYGSYQFPEKLIPLMIYKASRNEKLPVYGDGTNVRDWIHVLDHCKALEAVLHGGKVGEVYDIGGQSEKQNIEIVQLILNRLGKSEALIEFVKDRPGHDRRYAMDISKIKKDLGWEPECSFEEGMEKTIQWYLDNKEWVNHCISGEYQKYYEDNYGNRDR